MLESQKIIWFLSQLVIQKVENSKKKKIIRPCEFTLSPLLITYNSPRDKLL